MNWSMRSTPHSHTRIKFIIYSSWSFFEITDNNPFHDAQVISIAELVTNRTKSKFVYKNVAFVVLGDFCHFISRKWPPLLIQFSFSFRVNLFVSISNYVFFFFSLTFVWNTSSMSTSSMNVVVVKNQFAYFKARFRRQQVRNENLFACSILCHMMGIFNNCRTLSNRRGEFEKKSGKICYNTGNYCMLSHVDGK